MRAKQHGFTLVELSVVLVILGLLVGGMIEGQSLIRGARLRTVLSERDKISAAVLAFRTKYRALPGDMPNAVRYWGAAAGGTADGVDSTCAAYTTAATDSTTCNGNGDGQIEYYGTGNTQAYETFRIWQHLSNAGILEGSYSGVGANGGTDQIAGLNMPVSKYKTNHFWSLWYLPSRLTGASIWSPVASGHYVVLTAPTTNVWNADTFSPEDAFYLDLKTDDGMAYTGETSAFNGNLNLSVTPSRGCTQTDMATSTYDMTKTAIGCVLFMKAF